jgi:hypothetical protein
MSISGVRSGFTRLDSELAEDEAKIENVPGPAETSVTSGVPVVLLGQ